MNRLICYIAALVCAVLISVGLTAPAANASQVTSKECLNSGPVTMCLQVKYRVQADGTGVVLEGYWKDTPNGCGDLNSPPYYNESVIWANNATGATNHTYAMGDEPCNDYNDLTDRAGSDTGCYDFYFSTTANKHLATDKRFLIGFTLCKTSSSVDYRYVLDA